MEHKDKETTLQQVREWVQDFSKRRDWDQFHDPKNLAEAITIEAGELQEIFLWKDVEEAKIKTKEDEEIRRKVKEEFADILIYCLTFADSADIDIAQAIADKLAIAEERYPVEKSRGNSKKYTEL